MPYNINKYNGTLATTVEDGTVDNTFDIKLIGKNVAGYGEVQNENFVFLLENFANSSEPPRKITGQIWYDSANKKLKFYDGTKFKTTGGAEIGSSAPTGLSEGDFWFNTNTNQLYAWSGAEFILVGPQAVVNAGTTELRSRSVTDTLGGTFPIIEAIVDDVTIYIISSAEFTLDNAINEIIGFDEIKKGITLVHTEASTNGVTQNDYVYHGTSSNALKLGGVDASNFVRSDVSQYPTAIQRFADIGYTVGNDNDLRVFIDGTTPTISNDISSAITFTTYDGGIKTPLKLVGSNILPGTNNATNLGSLTAGPGNTELRFATIYATSFNGTATTSASLNVGATARTASTSVGINTIAARDGSGDLYANIFHGTATEAQYADLAEIYATDVEYEVGTVVTVGGEKEVTASKFGDRAIGVVSANPAYLMNKDAEGQAIALKGRVPVKVVGAVKKGDRLVASDNGHAIIATMHQYADVFAIALETSTDTLTKTIEAVIL